MKKKGKSKRVRLPSLKRLQARADRLWSKMILRDGQKYDFQNDSFPTMCQVCHSRNATTGHHVFHKGANGRVRYDRRNGLPICTGCHLRERFNPTPVVCAAIGYHGIAKFLELAGDVDSFPGRYVWTRERLNMVLIALETILEVPDAADSTAV